MSTISRLSRFQRLKYLSPENYLNGSLCFWRDSNPGSLTSFAKEKYEAEIQKWLATQERNIKVDNRGI